MPLLLLAAVLAAAPSASAAGPEDLGFDLFGDAASQPAQDPALAAAVARRRGMLDIHQILGLSTLGLMAGSSILGQLNYGDLYAAGGERKGHYLVAHRVMSYATLAGFLASAGFGIFAPEPYQKQDQGVDTATLHKLSLLGASLGLGAEVGLGFVAARKADAGVSAGNERLAVLHQIVGYTTLGFMALGAVVWVF